MTSRDGGSGPQEKFAMIPETLIDGARDSACVHLYGKLSRIQGKGGSPARGYRALAKQIGMAEKTVTTHARHLEADGWIRIEQTGRSKAVLRIVHNPSFRVGGPINEAGVTVYEGTKTARRRAIGNPVLSGAPFEEVARTAPSDNPVMALSAEATPLTFSSARIAEGFGMECGSAGGDSSAVLAELPRSNEVAEEVAVFTETPPSARLSSTIEPREGRFVCEDEWVRFLQSEGLTVGESRRLRAGYPVGLSFRPCRAA